MKYLIKHLTLVLVGLITLTACQDQSNQKRIGIIVPIEHKAMNEIVSGFSDTLKEESNIPVNIKTANAQGDITLQRAIIQQMKDEGYAVVVPIGLGATEMTLSMIHNQPIVSLGASYYEADRKKLKTCNITAVHDEIPPKKIIAFIHDTYPKLTQLTLVHSASEKIFPDVKKTVAAGKALGITIKDLMVPTLNDLYSVANALPKNTQGILVLKDNLIVSGISTLAISAAKQHIPLISSDQGSVQDGAAFALGVHEREIGVEGAKLVAQVLAGKAVCSLPMVDMTKLTVFINKDSLSKENQDAAIVAAAAAKAGYSVEETN